MNHNHWNKSKHDVGTLSSSYVPLHSTTFLRCSARSSFCWISASVKAFFFFFLRSSSLASLGGGLLTVCWPRSSDITSKLTVNAPRPIGRCMRPSSCRVANNCFSSTRSTGVSSGSGRPVHEAKKQSCWLLFAYGNTSSRWGTRQLKNSSVKIRECTFSVYYFLCF